MHENVVEHPETGKFYDCPECWWEGPRAPLNVDEWVMECPECGVAIDTELRDILAEKGLSFGGEPR